MTYVECCRFRLKVDHSIYEGEQVDEENVFAGIDPLLGRKKRAIPTHAISSIPKHYLKICYR